MLKLSECVLVLPNDLLLFYKWIPICPVAVQIASMHIHSGNAGIIIGGIIINSFVGIDAGSIISDLIFSGMHFHAAPLLIHRTQDMEKLTNAFHFAICGYRIQFYEGGADESGCRRQISREANTPHTSAVRNQFHGAKPVFRLCMRQIEILAQMMHMILKRRIVRQYANRIFINPQAILHALHSDRAIAIGQDPM